MFTKNNTTQNSQKFSLSKNELSLLENHGWKLLSIDDLSIQHIDGSKASKNSTLILLHHLKSDYTAFENLRLIIADQLDHFESATGHRIECTLTHINTTTQDTQSFYFNEDAFFPFFPN